MLNVYGNSWEYGDLLVKQDNASVMYSNVL